jgi:hypothetical protein
MSVTGVLIDWFLDAIECIKERSAKNVSKVSYSWASKLKLIIRAFIDLLEGFSTSSPLYFKMN